MDDYKIDADEFWKIINGIECIFDKEQFEKIDISSLSEGDIKEIVSLFNESKHNKLDNNKMALLDYLRYIKSRFGDIIRDRDKDAFDKDFWEFVKWWFNKSNYSPKEGQKCYYCGSTQEQWIKIIGNMTDELEKNKFHKSAKRSWWKAIMEVDKKDPKKKYSADNCVAACHICNNAKSDIIHDEDFKEFFAPGIAEYINMLCDEEKDNKQ